jgi:signal transduction histidine kinase
MAASTIRRDITERNQSIAERTWAETQLAGDKQLLEMIATGRSLRDVLNALCSFVEEAATGCYCGVYPIDWSGPTFEYGVAPSLPASYIDPIKGLPVRRDIAPCGIAAFEKEQVIVPDIGSDPRWVGTPYQAHVLAHGLRSVWSTPICSLEESVLGTFCVYQRSPANPSPRLQSLIAQVTHIASIAIERSRAEEALRKLESDFAHMNRVSMMGELAASLSHEITQPIASARNNVRAAMNFLEMQPADLGEIREALACVVGDVDRARDIVDRIRDHVKKEPPRKDHFDLNAAINEVIVLARSAIIRNGVLVQTRLADGLCAVYGDRIQLQQVILNLILNAVEAMGSVEAGPRDLLLSTEPDRIGVLVAVRDSGPGIVPEHLERVFEAFYTTKSTGVGMGLSICRSIVNAHGGRLWADVNAPRGAVFQFSLPGKEKELMNSFPAPRRTGEAYEDTVLDASRLVDR